jgi:hypothetical protein
MKTKLLLSLVVLMFVITTSFAKSPETSMRNAITSHIEFPKVAAEMQAEGAVFAEFIVKEDGNIEVLNCFSLVGELQSYIFRELSTIKVIPDAELKGKTFLMRFDFKLEKN